MTECVRQGLPFGPLYQEIAWRVAEYHDPHYDWRKKENEEWLRTTVKAGPKHLDACEAALDLDASTPQKLVFIVSIYGLGNYGPFLRSKHCMVVRPSLRNVINLRISGRNIPGWDDPMKEGYREWLLSDVGHAPDKKWVATFAIFHPAAKTTH